MIDPEKQQRIDHLVQTDETFRRLYREHQELSKRVEELSKRRNRSDAEQEELRDLKKQKLQAKDAMGRILFEDEMRQ